MKTLLSTRLALLIATLTTSLTALAQVPRIDPTTPSSGHVGSPITITGANFSPAPGNNIVYFGAVRAVVTAASANSLTAIVPAGATYASVTVTVGGLSASARLPFDVKFNNSAAGISFAPRTDFPAEPGETPAVAIADLDGDGKSEVIVANRASHSFSVFRNVSAAGGLAGAAFAPKVDFSTPAAQDGPVSLAIADLDGDGKLDVVIAEPSGGNIFVYRNNSTGGSLAFDAPVVFSGGNGGCGDGAVSIAISDLDGDGKPDLVAVESCGATVNVLRNTSSPGSINGNSFAGLVSFYARSITDNGTRDGSPSCLAIADLDGDGQPDVAVGIAQVGPPYSSMSLSRNISTVGNIAFENPVDLTFDNFLTDGDPKSLAIGDLAGDGKLEIAIGSPVGGRFILSNLNSLGSYFVGYPYSIFNLTEVGAPSETKIAIGDLDGDGRPDIAGASDFSGTDGAESIAIGDLDGDGQPDLVMAYPGGGVISVFLNTIAPGIAPPISPALDFGFQTLESFEFRDPFGNQSGGSPSAGLMQAPDGAFYGVTELGGSSGLGTVFKMTPDGTGGYMFRVIHDFSGPGGGNPDTAIVQGSDGALYGTTPERGSFGGSVFKLTPDRTGGYAFTTLHIFGGSDGAHPSRLLQATDGAFYGMTYDGGPTGSGTVFKVTSDGSSFIVLHSFIGSDGSGAAAITGLAQGSDGALYGTTINGGNTGYGTVFKMNPDGTGYTVLWNFGLTDGDGRNPIGAVLGTDGALYGVTGKGGSSGRGTVFKLSKDGTGVYATQVLHSFNGTDGQNPVSEMLGPDGALYGTTDSGGSSSAGTVFKINSDGSGFMLLHVFSGPDGARPASIPVLGTDGALYGTTYGAIYGGASFGGGTVFRLSTAPSLSTLSPDSALAGSSGFTLTLNGLRFESGAAVLWNGVALPTTFVSDSQVQAAVSASDLTSGASFTTATVTVRNPDGSTSNPQLFTITSANIGLVQSGVALPNQGASVATPNISTPLTQPGDAAVAATVINAGLPGQIAVTAATYTGNPTTGTIIDVGGGYVDLKITGADAGDSATAYFYYPSSVTGATENGLSLLYFTGTIWMPVLSSGGSAPIKNATDNLDGTVSGGRFAVVFDNTSTPKITELSGTVFSMTIRDTTPPVIHCPANIVTGNTPGQCSAVVNYTVTATDNSGVARVTSTPPSGSVFPKGVTTVNCTATDGSGNQSSCSFTVTVNDTEKPTITCPADITVASLADLPAPNLASVIAHDNCPGVTVAWVSDSAPSDGSCGGTIVRTYRATDASGNQATGTQRITVLPQLAFSDEHVAVHYHTANAAGATAQNPAYSKAEVHGFVQFCDLGQISDGILSSLSARQVGVRVRAILSGIVIADSTFNMSVGGDQRQAWEADLGKSGPVGSFKVHWQGALRFTDEDSNPHSPKISSQFIGLNNSSLRYEAKAGTYTTTLPNGVSVVVTNSKISRVTGLDATAYEIRSGQTKVDLDLPYRLVPGMVIQTTGGIQETITVTAGVNYWTEQAKYEVHLQANGLTQLPLFNATPDTLQYEITLGTGAGEHPAFGRSTIATGAKPWSQRQDNHKLFNDDATE